MNARWPMYIVSKGRWESRLTSRALEDMGAPYFVVVEESEYSSYASVIDSGKLLVLDTFFQDAYDTCDDLGASKSKGPGPARNFAWAHAIAHGHAWHWVMDDNIRGFHRLWRNKKILARTGSIFRAMEDFSERYENVAMAGPCYRAFIAQGAVRPPFITNTRIYSCNLIRTDVPFRWRGRYNEDTDLSLRLLKEGWCTIQFYAFLQDKIRTQTMQGGNTDAFYAHEGTLEKSRMLARLHPDVAQLVMRYGRWHHHVNYRVFQTPLRVRPGAPIPIGPNEYGMRLAVRTDRVTRQRQVVGSGLGNRRSE